MFAIYHTQRFDNELNKLSVEEQRIIRQFEQRIAITPLFGKLLYSTFVREKKLNGKRAYFILCEQLQAILFVATSDKKAQQQTINEIKGDILKNTQESFVSLQNAPDSSFFKIFEACAELFNKISIDFFILFLLWLHERLHIQNKSFALYELLFDDVVNLPTAFLSRNIFNPGSHSERVWTLNKNLRSSNETRRK